MDLRNVAIATIAWARDEKEEALLRKALTELAQLSIPVFITDGGSRESFTTFLKDFPHFKVLQPDGVGVWAQARKSLVAAHESGADFIFYTEPDKYDFFVGLKNLLSEIVVNDVSGIVVASRTKEGFKTFPAFQQMTETTINNCCAEMIKQAVDYTYGPFLLNSNLVEHLLKITEDIGWGWRPLVFGLAFRLGYTIESIEGNYYCPLDQRQDTPRERIYRMKQLKENIHGVVMSTTIDVRL